MSEIRPAIYLHRLTGGEWQKVHYRHPSDPMTALCQSPSPSTRMVGVSQIPEHRELCQSCVTLKSNGKIRPLRADRKGGKTHNQQIAGELTRELKRLGIKYEGGNVNRASLVKRARLVAQSRGDDDLICTKEQARAYAIRIFSDTLQIEKSAQQTIPKVKPEFAASNEFLQSYDWRKLRMLALKEHGARCQCCGATPKDGAVMNVDHILPRKKYPHLALALSNLQILCHECNHGKGNWDMTDWR